MSNATAEIVQISIATAKAAAKWGNNALISPTALGYQIHLSANEPLRSMQKAGRSLDNLGICQLQLAGSGWSKDLQWAFYQGFCNAKRHDGVAFNNEQGAAEQLVQLAQCFSFAKKMINETPEVLSPLALAEQAETFIRTIAPEGTVSSELISAEELANAGWHGIYQVGRGSSRPPALLVLDFNPGKDNSQSVAAALVGKGITFDSGGYSIKPTEGMATMKCDMGGAATVTAALALAILQGLNQRVKLILCCAENLISGHAYKLGDIITYKNGTTVEIVNTDAEGRLVLADGLMCASETKAPLIIDAATLTGAAMVAVGGEYNALFALDQPLATRALQYAANEQEATWQLPLQKWHQQQCPSPYADTANSRPVKGGGAGGASNAAGFLSRFVPNDGKGWLHFDLAAAFNNSANGYWAAGATGQGIRSIAAILLAETAAS
ncbi:aminopeptidase B [Arsukibacterium ikkense]|uniref:Aminopeptidase B n=1 Tax=Arsukibacterium ikkense TaxID=336831 RepID=A0A0M2V1E2_9GAMM|nr:aminopeptidase PepB [Arsukibacterium ikkense]KKO44456.1 aminopeptidase B [Arsukibacterium ikkense]